MEEEIRMAVECLAAGKILLYPTDTIWGIGCDATDENAVEKIYRIKRRQDKKSLIILLDRAEKLPQYVEHVPASAYELIRKVTTPLTVIYPKAINLAPNVIAGDGTIAIRIVRDEFCQRMIREFGKPVVSSSANISGEAAPLVFSKISTEILKAVDHTVGLYRDLVRSIKPSTIIRLKENGEFEVLRN